MSEQWTLTLALDVIIDGIKAGKTNFEFLNIPVQLIEDLPFRCKIYLLPDDHLVLTSFSKVPTSKKVRLCHATFEIQKKQQKEVTEFK